MQWNAQLTSTGLRRTKHCYVETCSGRSGRAASLYSARKYRVPPETWTCVSIWGGLADSWLNNRLMRAGLQRTHVYVFKYRMNRNSWPATEYSIGEGRIPANRYPCIKTWAWWEWTTNTVLSSWEQDSSGNSTIISKQGSDCSGRSEIGYSVHE